MASGKSFVIALEEHYLDPEVARALQGSLPHGGAASAIASMAPRLLDLGDGRLRAMDEAGIDLQVISHVPSPVQQTNPESAVQLATGMNDRLYGAVQSHPDRYAGFAALPTPDPEAAAEELERAVTKLGFKGAMIHGRTQGHFHDEKQFWPIFERAEALDVPIYIHPGPPHPAIAEAYYAYYLQDFPMLDAAAWGFTIDTASQAVRLIVSGLFDAYPRLKIVLGHLGEGLPFFVDRIDEYLKSKILVQKPIEFREILSNNFGSQRPGISPHQHCCVRSSSLGSTESCSPWIGHSLRICREQHGWTRFPCQVRTREKYSVGTLGAF